MKKILLCCSAIGLCCVLITSCASKNSFRLNGSVSGFTGDVLVLTYYDVKAGARVDTIQVKDGSFSFSSELNGPTAALLQGGNFSKALAIAPGYDLKITANAVTNAIAYDGTGATANKFYTGVDTVDISHFFIRTVSKQQFADSLGKARAMQETVYQEIDKDADKKDATYPLFVKVAGYDNTFKRFRYAIQYLDQNFADFTPEEADSFIKSNFDERVIANLSNDSLLYSPAFRDMMGNDHHYVFYRAKMNLRKDTARVVDHDYFLKTIDQSFKGKVRDYVRENFLRNNLIARGRQAGG